ncbi:MAG: hypothetical protein DMG65_11660 [Candidatus Angelobacter sp. Gp1-AA117]|nr:MAG: hypothetical protein DMG65_11660 [Candidatus Angelobacter sp. Gp1-AA117]
MRFSAFMGGRAGLQARVTAKKMNGLQMVDFGAFMRWVVVFSKTSNHKGDQGTQRKLQHIRRPVRDASGFAKD